MRHTTSAILGLLVCPALGAAQDFDNIQIQTIRVTESIYMLQGSGGNIGVSIGDDGTFIVDDQFAPLTDKIVAAIAELTDHPVDFVVNSHWHYDHTDGNENFGRAGAIIVAQDNSRRRMETEQIISLNGRVQPPYAEVGLPKITFLESMRFYYNDNVVDVIHTGDMFVRYGLPFIDQPNGGSMDGMIDALWTIAGLIDDDTIIIPGHGQLSTRTASWSSDRCSPRSGPASGTRSPRDTPSTRSSPPTPLERVCRARRRYGALVESRLRGIPVTAETPLDASPKPAAWEIRWN